MDTSYHALTSEDNELWKHHAAGIEESIRQAFPSIPASFQLKPVTIRKIPACGMLYDFKIGLPDCQYAKVSFHTGGLRMTPRTGEPVPEEKQHYNVDSTPSASKDE